MNALHSATRALAERGNSLLKTPSRRYVGSASARGGSARSPPPHCSCPTTSTTGRPDQLATGNGSVDRWTPVLAVRLEVERAPDPPDRRFRQPVRSAILARGQCVAFRGTLSSVETTTSSTRSALIVGGRPGRGSSVSPSKPSAMNRNRHLPTVAPAHPRSAATVLLPAPSGQASTIRERNARACEDFRRRAHRCNCSRSSSVTTNSAFGSPVLAINRPFRTYDLNLRRGTLAHPPRCLVPERSRLVVRRITDGFLKRCRFCDAGVWVVAGIVQIEVPISGRRRHRAIVHVLHRESANQSSGLTGRFAVIQPCEVVARRVRRCARWHASIRLRFRHGRGHRGKWSCSGSSKREHDSRDTCP